MLEASYLSEACGQQREQFKLLCLVVNELGLFFLATDVLELSSHAGVTESDQARLHQNQTSTTHD